MPKFRGLLYSALLFVLVVGLFATTFKICMILWETPKWGLIEHMCIFLVIQLNLLTIYGILNSFFEKVKEARAHRLVMLDLESKAMLQKTAEKPPG